MEMRKFGDVLKETFLIADEGNQRLTGSWTTLGVLLTTGALVSLIVVPASTLWGEFVARNGWIKVPVVIAWVLLIFGYAIAHYDKVTFLRKELETIKSGGLLVRPPIGQKLDYRLIPEKRTDDIVRFSYHLNIVNMSKTETLKAVSVTLARVFNSTNNELAILGVPATLYFSRGSSTVASVDIHPGPSEPLPVIIWLRNSQTKIAKVPQDRETMAIGLPLDFDSTFRLQIDVRAEDVPFVPVWLQVRLQGHAFTVTRIENPFDEITSA